jgi:hypothetical protein
MDLSEKNRSSSRQSLLAILSEDMLCNKRSYENLKTNLIFNIPKHAFIFSAEAIAILIVLDNISQSTQQDFLILSDSLSFVNAVENRNLEKPLVVEILERVHQ